MHPKFKIQKEQKKMHTHYRRIYIQITTTLCPIGLSLPRKKRQCHNQLQPEHQPPARIATSLLSKDHNDEFQARLAELLAYKKKHTYIPVPPKYEPNIKLGAWVLHQKNSTTRKLGCLTFIKSDASLCLHWQP